MPNNPTPPDEADNLALQLIVVEAKPDGGRGGPWWIGLRLDADDALWDTGGLNKDHAYAVATVCRAKLADHIRALCTRQAEQAAWAMRERCAQMAEHSYRGDIPYEREVDWCDSFAKAIRALPLPSGPAEPATHASAPVGYKCSDCTIGIEPCPICYAAAWRKRHPNIIQLTGSPAEDQPTPETPCEPGGNYGLCKNHPTCELARKILSGPTDDGTAAELAEALEPFAEYCDFQEGKKPFRHVFMKEWQAARAALARYKGKTQ